MRICHLCSIAAVVCVTTVSLASAEPIVEDWSRARGSYDLHAVAPDRFAIVTESESATKSARFTVQGGDKFKTSTGERSEVVLGGPRDTSPFAVWGDEGVEYYRISVKLESGWRQPEFNVYGQRWGLFFQVHGPNTYTAPPAVSLHAEDKFGLFILGGDMAKKRGGYQYVKNPTLVTGKWVDFILGVKWSVGTDGWVMLYRRDEGESKWDLVSDVKSVPTLQYLGAPVAEKHYWKAGFYRSESSNSNTLWLGPIVRAKSYDEAATYLYPTRSSSSSTESKPDTSTSTSSTSSTPSSDTSSSSSTGTSSSSSSSSPSSSSTSSASKESTSSSASKSSTSSDTSTGGRSSESTGRPSDNKVKSAN